MVLYLKKTSWFLIAIIKIETVSNGKMFWKRKKNV
jgi:hypothetical protein